MKILISDAFPETEFKRLDEYSDVSYDFNTGLSPDELKNVITDYNAIIVRSATKVTKEIMDAAPNLKLIIRGGVGLDNVDLEYAKEKGIEVMNTPEASTISVAEHAIGLMFAIARNTSQADVSMKSGKWEKKKFKGIELHNKKLGIIGVGRIGSAVAERAKALGMSVMGYDPYIENDDISEMGVMPVKLDKLVEEADFISIHIPLSDETRNLLSDDQFNVMKDGIVIINCARGGVVDEKALTDAIKNGKVRGVGVDVFENEPPEGLELVQLPQVIASPHVAASTAEGQLRVAATVVDKIIAKLK